MVLPHLEALLTRRGHAAGLWAMATTCIVVAACEPIPPRQPVSQLPPVFAAPQVAASQPVTVQPRDQACVALNGGASEAQSESEPAAPGAETSEPPTAQLPDPQSDSGQQAAAAANPTPPSENFGEQVRARAAELAAVAPGGQKAAAPPNAAPQAENFGEHIRTRAAELAAVGAADGQAEKAETSGRTARAAQLFSEEWRATPGNWRAAFHAVELWSRVGGYLRAEVLLAAVEAAATSAQDDEIVQQAKALDDKLGIQNGAKTEAIRLWRRSFALESEYRYTEAVAVLKRLQEFEPDVPGYYVKEAGIYAHCGIGIRAADAIARGSAAGVAYDGRWAPARDPEIVRLWKDPVFAAEIRDTLGDTATEEFEERSVNPGTASASR